MDEHFGSNGQSFRQTFSAISPKEGLDSDQNDSTHESRIKFHRCHSCNVRLNYNKTKAYRDDGFTDAVCFSNRPIAVYEKINVRLIEITNEWDGALRFGFTNQDPAVTDDIIWSVPLGHGADICAYELFDEYAHKNKILHYWFESNGCLIYNVDNEPVTVMNSNIKADIPLWAVIDLYGKTVGIEFVSKGLKSQPYHSNAENILHFNDVHGGNVILSSEKSKARRIGSFEDAVCFSNRPIILNEKMYVRLKRISNEWNGALKFGFTSHNPALNIDFISTVPLGYRTHSWIDELFGKDVQTNNTLQFWFESNGSLMYNINNGPITVRNYKVNTDVLLWAVIDMYGKTVEIEMVTQETLSDDLFEEDSCTSLSLSDDDSSTNLTDEMTELSSDIPPLDEDIRQFVDYTKRPPPQLFTEYFKELPSDIPTFDEDIRKFVDYTKRPSSQLFTSYSKELSSDITYPSFDEDILKHFNFEKRTPPPLFTAYSKGNIAEKPVISETARKTCETVLVGFEMGTTENILIHGDINMDCYQHTENAETMKNDLDSNGKLWKDKSTPEAIRLGQVRGLLEAIEKRDYTEILKIYYRAQHQHTLDHQMKPLDILVYIHRNQLNSLWIPHVQRAIQAINEVTPGINIFETKERRKSMIRIGVDELKKPDVACTINGGILKYIQDPQKAKPFIHLGNDWNVDYMKGTSVHELMHALGFHHEMQRFDSDMYLDFKGNVGHNYDKNKYKDKVLTRFDPFSVMMYSLSTNMEAKKKCVPHDPIWALKTTRERCQVLSELNKVALNLKYKPCVNQSKNYSPKLSIQTEMLYCGRKVMVTHNQVGGSTTDGFCGPNNWANCPACRVITRISGYAKQSIEIPKLEKCLGKGKWQGLSGLFYCGKKDTKLSTDLKHVKSDGICGPDTGVPCTDCGQELFKGYSISCCDNIFKPRH